MSKRKVTDWYPPDVKPVRVGLYERIHRYDLQDGSTITYMNLWDGNQWTYKNGMTFHSSSARSWHWRGLTERAT